MASSYLRPRAAWIRRRARRLMRCFDIERALAVREAADDYRLFVGRTRPALTLVAGGRS